MRSKWSSVIYRSAVLYVSEVSSLISAPSSPTLYLRGFDLKHSDIRVYSILTRKSTAACRDVRSENNGGVVSDYGKVALCCNKWQLKALSIYSTKRISVSQVIIS